MESVIEKEKDIIDHIIHDGLLLKKWLV